MGYNTDNLTYINNIYQMNILWTSDLNIYKDKIDIYKDIRYDII